MITAWRDRDPSRPATTLACTPQAVWLWPGIPLTHRRGNAILPRGRDTILGAVTKLHGPAAVHSAVTRAVERAGAHLSGGDLARAKRSLARAGLPPVTPDGRLLMRAVGAHLGLPVPTVPVGQSPRLWSDANIELFARRLAMQAIQSWPRIAKAGFDPDEPRDRNGRWTTGGHQPPIRGDAAHSVPLPARGGPLEIEPVAFAGTVGAAAVRPAIPSIGEAGARTLGRAVTGIADLGEIVVSAAPVAAALVLNSVITTPTAGKIEGSLAGRPDIHIAWNSDTGVLDIYRIGAGGKQQLVAHGRVQTDGTYRDAAGRILGRTIDGKLVIEPTILPGPPPNPVPPIVTPPFPAHPPAQLPIHAGHPAEERPPTIMTTPAVPMPVEQEGYGSLTPAEMAEMWAAHAVMTPQELDRVASEAAAAAKGAKSLEAAKQAMATAANRLAKGDTPWARGTNAHLILNRALEKLKESVGPALAGEISYYDGKVVDYGTKGSVRVDIVQGDPEKPKGIDEYKTGRNEGEDLSPNRADKVRSHLPKGYKNIPISKLRPKP